MSASDDTAGDAATCLECGATLTDRYCAVCGQRASIGPLRLRSIVGQVCEELIDFRLPILRTTWNLLWRPGVVTAQWVDGQRRSITSPVKYCILAGVVVALAARFLPQPDGDAARVEAGPVVFNASWLSEYLAFVSMLLLIPLALIMGGLSRVTGLRRRALDWYALGLHVYGMCVMLQVLLGLIALLWAPIGAITGALPVIWFSWGAYDFVRRERRWLALVMSIVGQILWIVVLIAIFIAIALALDIDIQSNAI